MRVKLKTQPIWTVGCNCVEIKVISILKGKVTKRLRYIRLIEVDVDITQVDRNWKAVLSGLTLRNFSRYKIFNIR